MDGVYELWGSSGCGGLEDVRGIGDVGVLSLLILNFKELALNKLIAFM